MQRSGNGDLIGKTPETLDCRHRGKRSAKGRDGKRPACKESRRSPIDKLVRGGLVVEPVTTITAVVCFFFFFCFILYINFVVVKLASLICLEW